MCELDTTALDHISSTTSGLAELILLEQLHPRCRHCFGGYLLCPRSHFRRYRPERGAIELWHRLHVLDLRLGLSYMAGSCSAVREASSLSVVCTVDHGK